MLLTGAESDGGYKVALAICQALRKSAPARTRNGALARVVSPWGEGRGGVWRLEPQPGERATCPGPPHRRLRCADRVHLPGAWGVRGHAQREGLPRHGLNRHRPMGMRTERSTTGCAANARYRANKTGGPVVSTRCICPAMARCPPARRSATSSCSQLPRSTAMRRTVAGVVLAVSACQLGPLGHRERRGWPPPRQPDQDAAKPTSTAVTGKVGGRSAFQ